MTDTPSWRARCGRSGATAAAPPARNRASLWVEPAASEGSGSTCIETHPRRDGAFRVDEVVPDEDGAVDRDLHLLKEPEQRLGGGLGRSGEAPTPQVGEVLREAGSVESTARELLRAAGQDPEAEAALGQPLQQWIRARPRDRARERLHLDRVDRTVELRLEPVQDPVARTGIVDRFARLFQDPVDGVVHGEMARGHPGLFRDTDRGGAHSAEIVVGEDERPIEVEADSEERFEVLGVRVSRRHVSTGATRHAAGLPLRVSIQRNPASGDIVPRPRGFGAFIEGTMEKPWPRFKPLSGVGTV